MASTVTSRDRPGYGQLLRTPGAWTFLLPGFAARQPFAMLTIGIVLLVQHTTGSYGSAGAVAAVTGVSMALFAPQSGRLADRFGQRAVLLPGVLVHAASVGGLTALALADAPAVGAVRWRRCPTGASVPQIGPMVRARWAAQLARPGRPASPLLPTAAAFESVTDEFTFVVGPVLATALCTGVHPAAGLIAEAALTLLGGLLFAAQRATQPAPRGRGHGGRSPHRSALVRARGARPRRRLPRHRRRLRRHAGLADRVLPGDRPARASTACSTGSSRPATCWPASPAGPSPGRAARAAGCSSATRP